MRLTIHDPGHVGLRRGIRAAIAIPLALAIALYVIDDVTGAIFTVFGSIGLLVNADFAGSARERLGSYLLTGVAGTVVLVIGWATSFTTPTAVVVTLVVAFTLSFVNLLRGPVAVGTPAVLLIYIVAVSLEGTSTNLTAYLAGWWLAVVVSTTTALLVLPRNRRADIRASLAAAFTAGARATEKVWMTTDLVDPAVAFAPFDAAVKDLDDRYGGQPFRAAGMTVRDQSVTMLVNMVNSIRLVLSTPDDIAIRRDAIPVRERTDLARCVVMALDDIATAMTDPTHLPSATDIDRTRVRLTAALESWVVEQSRSGVDARTISARIGADHVLRMAAVIIEQMVEVARVGNGGAEEDLERRPPVPVMKRSTIVLTELHPQSPWLRNALRSALGLALAVMVVNITGAEKGFWVLLGVVSILRFDAVGTRRFALQAVLGTVAGVVLATALVVSVGQHEWVLWLVLPAMVFLSAWSAAAVSYPVGQAAFSALVLVGLGILAWPPQPALGLIRIEDIALGAAVALVVGLLMWPRGAAGYLRTQLAEALRAGNAYLATSIGTFTQPTTAEELPQLRAHAVSTSERASQTYDLSLMQRGPSESVEPWTTATVAMYLLVSTARLLSGYAPSTPAVRDHPDLVAALDTACDRSRRHWTAVADAIEAGITSDDRPLVPSDPYPTLAPVDSTSDARALIITIWVVDWVKHLNGLPVVPGAPTGSGVDSARRLA